jgi:hypothetical protein
MSDADAFEQPIALTISESFTLASLGRISRRNNSGSQTVPGIGLVPTPTAPDVRR